MKKLFKYTLPALAICALVSCSEDATEPIVVNNSPVDPNSGKELIALSKDGGITRASLTRAGFTNPTRVVMCLKAVDKNTSNVRYATAVATASENKNADHTVSEGNISHDLVGDHSDLTYDSGYERYWDDAWGRNTRVTVWALAIPNKTTASLLLESGWSTAGQTAVDGPSGNNTNPNWRTGTENRTITWSVPTAQTKDNQEEKDLTYSNNISESGTGGRYTYSTWDDTNKKDVYNTTLAIGDGPMRWIPKTDAAGETTGKFDQGHLIFNHALAKVEINLTEGNGFNGSISTDFGWTSGGGTATQNMTLKKLYTTGTLDVCTGAWGSFSSENITQMYESEVSGTNTKVRKLIAYIVPGNNLYNETDNVINFEIDNAQYYVTGKQIADAIRTYYTTHDGLAHASDYQFFTVTKPGHHYIINLTVGKKAIERITAAILPWEEVNSDPITAKNTYLDFTFEDNSRGNRLTDADEFEFNIYRAAKDAGDYITLMDQANYDWGKSYEKATKTWNSTANEWGTDWYWENNRTYYHLRAAGIHNHTTTDPAITINETDDNNYYNITSGAITAPSSLTAGSALSADEASAYNDLMCPIALKAASGTLTSEEATAYNAKLNYKDYTWGAPFVPLANASAKLSYSTTDGFDNSSSSHQIRQAIAVTDECIHMLLFHMTSQVIVNVYTSTDASKVTLYDDKGNGVGADDLRTKVEILNFLPDGTVRMGNGLVEATSGARKDIAMTYPRGAASSTHGFHAFQAAVAEPASPAVAANVLDYTYGVVPQALSTGGQTIGLRITTPDGNQYLIRDLSTVEATVSTTNLSNPHTTPGTENTSHWTINRWYPNYQYTYNITITKKGIERITAAVVGWETVIGDNIDIDLEN